MSAKGNWKPVTIGGLTGIVLGAGTMYALQPGTAISEEAMPTPTADAEPAPQTPGAAPSVLAVSDDMSFGEAFAAGRAASGPGGLFTWRGNLYGTYTADEWNAMSEEEKNQFAERAYTAVRSTANDIPQTPEANMEENLLSDNDVQVAEERVEENVSFDNFDNDVQVARVDDGFHAENGPSEEPAHKVTRSWEDFASDDNDVRIVGYQDVEVGKGQKMGVEELDINGQRVAIIDVDNDGVGDYAMTDLNHNRQMDEGEVVDLHTGEAISFTNDEPEEDFNEAANTDDASDTEFGMI